VKPGDFFATTRWTVVLAAAKQDTPHAALALEELCGAYWYPLYAYIRRRGYSPEDAEDLVQSFFGKLLEKNYLKSISGDKGKFRAFLLVALKHFLANEWDKANRLKRGGSLKSFSLELPNDETSKQVDLADHLTPAKLYDRAWAVTLLERVVRRLRDESAADQKAEIFEELKPCLMAGKNAISYAHAASVLNLAEGAVRVAVHRLRKRYKELLRQEIGQTLADPAQVEEEIRALFEAFAP
jgi:RNA polymerase sigma-70 factor (ECF subfamily)